MTIPSYRDVDLALLLELVRLGRPAKPAEAYGRVERHFPLLTDEDRAARRRDGRTPLWTNMIHWARDHLRVQGWLEETQAGIWSANHEARRALRELLVSRGVEAARVDAFVAGEQSMASVFGRDWAKPWRASRQAKGRKATEVREPASPVDTQPARDVASDLSTLQEREIEALREQLLRRINVTDAYDFEQFVAQILEGLGFRDTVVVGRSGDEGVDIQCKLQNKLLSVTVAVQVKRQQGNVGPKEISYLRDRWSRRADKLMFVTTGGYTAGAREVADDRDLKPVLLVDGLQLADAMIHAQIGVVPRAVTRFELDPEFFTD